MTEDPQYLMGFLLTCVAGATTCLGLGFIPLVNSGIAAEKKSMSAALAFSAGVMLWLAFADAICEEATEHFTAYFEGRGEHSTVWVRVCVALFLFAGLLATALLEAAVDRCFGHSHSHGQDHGDGNAHSLPLQWQDNTRDACGGDARELELPTLLRSQVATGATSDCPEGATLEGGKAGDEKDAKANRGAECASADSMAEMSTASGSTVTGGSGSSVTTGSESMDAGDMSQGGPDRAALLKVSMVAMLALAVHNIPEGIAVFFSASTFNLAIVFGIALHNIPAGAAIAVPIYKSTGSYAKALCATMCAAMAQPLCALVTWLLVIQAGLRKPDDFAIGAVYAATGGTLIAIALGGLLPAALASSSPRFTLAWVGLGFALMELSIIVETASSTEPAERLTFLIV